MTATTCGSPREVDRHEQRAGDRVAVELELPIVGAPPRADARAAEPLPEHREFGDVEIGARERAAPVAARVAGVGARARHREPLVDAQLRQAAVQRDAALGAKLRELAAELERRAAERERLARSRRRIEIGREAARRAEVAVDGQRARGEREVELEVRRLAGRLCERLGEPQRDAGQVRRRP